MQVLSDDFCTFWKNTKKMSFFTLTGTLLAAPVEAVKDSVSVQMNHCIMI